MRILTFDIGGAYTKWLEHDDGVTVSSSVYFPVWKRKEELALFLTGIGREADTVAVTMTAELCDVFASKEAGSRFVVESCEEAFGDPLFLTSDRRLVKKEDIKDYNKLGAANWLASRYFMEQRYGSDLLVDIGSTTTDILPFGGGLNGFKSDFERLKSSELLYTGILRTPVNTIINELHIKGNVVSAASEYFAITADVYNILWGISYTCDTPDGKGKSREDSIRRVARLLCAEPDEVRDYIEGICHEVYEKQVTTISRGLRRVSRESRMNKVYAAGIGRRLGIEAAEMAGLQSVDLEEEVKDAWNLPCLGLLEMLKEDL